MTPGAPTIRFHDPAWDPSLLPGPVPWLWILGAALGIIALALLLFVTSTRHRPRPRAVSRQEAFAEALRVLDEAVSLDPSAAATRASLAIRSVLAAVARDPSLFETHEEFLARHPALGPWPADTVDSLISTLRLLAAIQYRPPDESQDPASFIEQSRALLQALDRQSAA